MTEEEIALDIAMGNLYRAKWNIPRAVEHLGRAACFKEWETLKESFKEYCTRNPPTWNDKRHLSD